MNDGSIGSTFNEGIMKVEGETAYCIDIDIDFRNGYKTRADTSTRMSEDQSADVALSGMRNTPNSMPPVTDREFAYYVSGNALEPVGGNYLFSELINPVFAMDGNNVKVSVSVAYLDQTTKVTQISQFDLILTKADGNWKII